MYNEKAVAEFNELVEILKEMPVPTLRRNLMKQGNIRWLRRHIKPEWHSKSKYALELLKKCDNTDPSGDGGASPVWQETLRRSYEADDIFKEKYLKEKGLEVTVNHWPGTPLKVYSVKLDFTAEEWVDLMNTEGEFLPMCCATISNIRDVLIGCLREGGFIRVTELFEICEALKNHHDCSDEGSDPQNRLMQTWDKIKDDADLHLLGHPVDPNDLDDAFNILYHSAATLAWNMLNDDEEDEQRKLTHEVVRIHEFSRVLPSIRTIYKALKEKKFEPLEGYGVAEGDELLSLTSGLAIFAKEERAKEISDMFNEREKKQRSKDRELRVSDAYREKAYGTKEARRTLISHKYTIRKVRLSVEKGVEFLD
jgi:hypothetical protein